MKIAHFSDLHVLSLEGVGPHRFLNKRLTGLTNLRLKRGHAHRPSLVRAVAREIKGSGADHVVITGDLTNLALETEFAAVRALLDEELGLSPDAVSIIPGNHDLYTRGSLQTKRFAKYFGEYMRSDLPVGVEVEAGLFPFVRLRGPVAIIGLSSAVPRLPFFSHGKIGPAQLEAFGRALAHPEVKKRTPVVLMHHPAKNPLSKIETMMRGLEDAALLWTTLKDLPRGLVLHGHLHVRIQRPLPTSTGQLHSIGATSASLEHEDDARRAGFNLYHLDEVGVVKRVEAHVYDPEREAFEISSVPRFVDHPATPPH
ncbi:MAG TPA: metallophosphoesterase [Polyangiaceae bacterium]